MFLVEWRTIDYNIGNYFDGTTFTAPKTGLYSFNATAIQYQSNSRIELYANNALKMSMIDNPGTGGSYGNMVIQTTLKLAKDEKVEIRFSGKLLGAVDSELTCYEGRFISPIEE